MNWISVNDSLPTEFDQIIVNNHVPTAQDKNVVICAVFSEGKFYTLEEWGNNDPEDNESIRIRCVSHWMNLPEPPTL